MIELHFLKPKETWEKMQEEEIILLDVRKENEFNEGKIDGSILLPHQEVPEKVEKFIPNKEQLIVVYCRNGIRSEIASEMMIVMGYRKVYSLDGGLQAWKKEGLPLDFP